MTSTEPAEARGWASALATLLLVAAILTSFLVSGMALTAIGFEYDSSNGPSWQKFHPSTYFAALAMVLRVLGQPHPTRYLASLPRKFPGAALFMIMLTLLTVYGVRVQEMPFTPLVEPYVVALVALVAHDDLSPTSRSFVRKALHVILVANALIGILEVWTQTHLIPADTPGEPDARATALFGHPLQNAATMGAYSLCLVLGGDPHLKPVPRAAIIGLSLLSLLAFGGRTALLMTLLIVSGVVLWRLAQFLFGARVEFKHVLAGLAISPLIMLGAASVASAGVFDRVLARFVDDNGSGQARVIALELFNLFDVGDMLFGPRPDVLNSALNTLGISVAIENTWLALFFFYGGLMTGLFVVGLFSLFWEYWRRARPGALLLFFYFVVLLTSANGLSAKTMMFAHFSIVLLFFFGQESQSPQRGARIRSGRQYDRLSSEGRRMAWRASRA